jgi:hypothetical protein
MGDRRQFRRNRALYPSLLVLVALTLIGCAIHNPDYPKTWASQASGTDSCAPLNGTYRDVGEYGDPRLADRPGVTVVPPHLSYSLRLQTPFEGSQYKEPLKVRLTFDRDRVLRAELLAASGVIAERSFSEKLGELACAGGDAKILARAETRRSACWSGLSTTRPICRGQPTVLLSSGTRIIRSEPRSLSSRWVRALRAGSATPRPTISGSARMGQPTVQFAP